MRTHERKESLRFHLCRGTYVAGTEAPNDAGDDDDNDSQVQTRRRR